MLTMGGGGRGAEVLATLDASTAAEAGAEVSTEPLGICILPLSRSSDGVPGVRIGDLEVSPSSSVSSQGSTMPSMGYILTLISGWRSMSRLPPGLTCDERGSAACLLQFGSDSRTS